MVRQRGFNLIEALVTLTVLGLLIATALPSMSDWMHSTTVRTVAQNTENGLQKARGEAIKRNAVVTFWLVSPNTTTSPDSNCALSASSAAWVVSLDDPTGHCGDAASPTVAPRIVDTYGPGNNAGYLTVAGTATDKTTAANSVSFNGYGQRVGTGALANIDFAYGSDTTVRALRIQISTSGSIRMCDPAASVVAPDPRACN
jgi:type IV fimbrial biogenesis protein FimT